MAFRSTGEDAGLFFRKEKIIRWLTQPRYTHFGDEMVEQERWFVRVRFSKIEGWIPSQYIKVHNNNNSAPRTDLK